MSSDLLGDFAAITGADRAGAGGGGRSVSGARLFAGGDATVTRFVDAATVSRRAGDRGAAALVAWKLLVVMVTNPAVIAYVRHRRVPDLRPGNLVVAVDQPAAGSGTVRLRPGMAEPRFWVLEDDPAAHHPAARTVTAEGLRTRLRATVVDDLTDPLLARYREEARLGERGMRALAASIWYQVPGYHAPELTADQRFAEVDELLTCLGEHLGPLVQEAVVDVHDGSALGTTGVAPTAIRTACCLRYRLPDVQHCASCSLLDDGQRVERYAALGASWRRRR